MTLSKMYWLMSYHPDFKNMQPLLDKSVTRNFMNVSAAAEANNAC